MANIWMVRSQGGEILPLFKNHGVVALGWDALGDLTGKSKNQIKEMVIKHYPNEKAVYQWGGIVDTFVNVIRLPSLSVSVSSRNTYPNAGIDSLYVLPLKVSSI